VNCAVLAIVDARHPIDELIDEAARNTILLKHRVTGLLRPREEVERLEHGSGRRIGPLLLLQLIDARPSLEHRADQRPSAQWGQPVARQHAHRCRPARRQALEREGGAIPNAERRRLAVFTTMGASALEPQGLDERGQVGVRGVDQGRAGLDRCTGEGPPLNAPADLLRLLEYDDRELVAKDLAQKISRRATSHARAYDRDSWRPSRVIVAHDLLCSRSMVTSIEI